MNLLTQHRENPRFSSQSRKYVYGHCRWTAPKSEQFGKFLGNTAIPRSSHDREVSFAAQQENVYHPVFDTNLAVNL